MSTESSWMARLPWVLLALSTAWVVISLPLSIGHEPLFDTVLYGLQALAFATTGAFVAARHPRNPIGWIFSVQGFDNGFLEMWDGLYYHGFPASKVMHWTSDWWFVVDGSMFGLVFLLFPTGRLLSSHWRRVVAVLALAVLLGAPGQSMTTRNPNNPFAVDSPVVELMVNVGLVLLIAGIGLSMVALVMRFRRAVGIERLQLKQLVFAAALSLPSMMLAVVFDYESVLVQILIAAATSAVPIAAGLAILRYRLYDIDVVINRTLVYGALTATLAAVYLASVLLFQLALSPFIEGSSLAVAVSTLTVAALFRPVRARIQDAVDRRFFRHRYDAGRTVERFGARMRDQVDLDDIGIELRGVVADTIQPAHLSLWLREPEVGR